MIDRVVLCVGHMPTDTYRHLIGQPGYAHDAPSYTANYKSIQPNEAVGIIGSKLSAIDVALELRARGHLGPILMASR